MTAMQKPLSWTVAEQNQAPKSATVYTLIIDSRNPGQLPEYDKMFFNDKLGRNWEASSVLHNYIDYHGILWKSTRILNVTHYGHGDNRSGHFIIEGLVFN